MYSLTEYVEFAKAIHSARGVYGIYKEGTSYVYESLLRQAAPVLDKKSEFVLDKEWDVLVILDACRVDALEEVADEYEFLPSPPHPTIWSADSYSEGWLEKNFTSRQAIKHRKRMQSLSHITGNPFTDMFDGDEFGELDEVWRYGWDDENGHMPPDIITDRAITHHREVEPNQMLVHYMQPHAPFINSDTTDYDITLDEFANPSMTLQKRTPWELLRDGELDEDTVWNAYINNLRIVLDSVKVLLKSIDAETVVISADHGNGMGEWGIYGHPPHIPLAPVRNVPWVKTTAVNTDEYMPEDHDTAEITADREQQLKDLGYK